MIEESLLCFKYKLTKACLSSLNINIIKKESKTRACILLECTKLE